KALEAEYGMTRDTDVGGRFDMTLPVTVATELRYGAKVRLREKRNDFDFCGYEPDFDLTLDEAGTRIEDAYFPTQQGPYPSAAGARAIQAVAMNMQDRVAMADGTWCAAPGSGYEFSGDEEEASIPADWYTDEDVYAAYV